MSRVLRSVVTGVGGYMPDLVVTNDDLAKVVDTSDAWITERTGIRKRHRAAADQPVSDLATVISKAALPMVVLPVVMFVIAVGAHLLMLASGAAILAVRGIDASALWTGFSLPRRWI